MKENYDNLATILNQVKDEQYQRDLCEDLIVIDSYVARASMGLCLYNTRETQDHCITI